MLPLAFQKHVEEANENVGSTSVENVVKEGVGMFNHVRRAPGINEGAKSGRDGGPRWEGKRGENRGERAVALLQSHSRNNALVRAPESGRKVSGHGLVLTVCIPCSSGRGGSVVK